MACETCLAAQFFRAPNQPAVLHRNRRASSGLAGAPPLCPCRRECHVPRNYCALARCAPAPLPKQAEPATEQTPAARRRWGGGYRPNWQPGAGRSLGLARRTRPADPKAFHCAVTLLIAHLRGSFLTLLASSIGWCCCGEGFAGFLQAYMQVSSSLIKDKFGGPIRAGPPRALASLSFLRALPSPPRAVISVTERNGAITVNPFRGSQASLSVRFGADSLDALEKA